MCYNIGVLLRGQSPIPVLHVSPVLTPGAGLTCYNGGVMYRILALCYYIGLLLFVAWVLGYFY